MKRMKDMAGVVHFRGKNDIIALCGTIQSANLTGQPDAMGETSDAVTCPICATLYCRIKNAPWNEVHGATLDAAIYDAVKEDTDAGTPLQ